MALSGSDDAGSLGDFGERSQSDFKGTEAVSPSRRPTGDSLLTPRH